jgi:hypothetical protein
MVASVTSGFRTGCQTSGKKAQMLATMGATLCCCGIIRLEQKEDESARYKGEQKRKKALNYM